jgi:hypothetical protein
MILKKTIKEALSFRDLIAVMADPDHMGCQIFYTKAHQPFCKKKFMITVDENNRLIETLPSSEFNLKFETEIAAEKLKILENLGIYKIIDLPVGIIQFRSKFPGVHKTHHTEIYPCLHEPNRRNQVSYVFVHGSRYGK